MKGRRAHTRAMLFLLNNAVLNLDDLEISPRMTSRGFKALSFNAVTWLGQEMFAAQPLLHVANIKKAKRLASLLVMKAPQLNSALFAAPRAGCDPEEVSVRYASIGFEIMASLYTRQKEGRLDALMADRQVWRRMAA
jgi:hypothetical protein